jgi:hypothetical protein
VNQNEPAFGFVWNDDADHVCAGLTKREYIATHLMAGYVSNSALFHDSDFLARLSVQAANELLKELEKPTSESEVKGD